MENNKFEDKLKEIFDDPLLKGVEGEDLSLFEVPQHLDLSKGREQPDYVARRKRCEDFHLYELGFKRVHQELKSGKRSLVEYSIQNIRPGTYFLIDGELVYLESLGEVKKDSRARLQGRTRCVYENGTESNIQFDTLRRNLNRGGYIITENEDELDSYFESQFTLSENDRKEGYIYVLQSLSNNAQITEVEDLYKIGFTTQPVKERIANAEQDPTYLMDKVKVITTWNIYNMNPQKLEALIHQFFSAARWNVSLKDQRGDIYTPQEWYMVPLGIIETAISKILDKSIINYRYNPSLKSLEQISSSNSNRLKTEGLKILALSIKRDELGKVVLGEDSLICREIKESNKNRFIEFDALDGKMYLKRYDALRLQVRGNKESALVQVIHTTYNSKSRKVEYHLGNILELNGKKQS